MGASHDNPVGAYEANVLATFNLLEACRRQGGVEAIVAVSSNHVYGEQHHLPTPEDAPLNGTGMYAASKLAADVLARAYGKTYGLPVGIARMTNSYGGDDHHLAHIITATILSALKNERPVIKQSGRDRKGYLYIKDTAEGLLAVAEGVAAKRELRGEAFNLVPNDAVTVNELVAAILDVVGVKCSRRFSIPRRHTKKNTWTTPRPGCSAGRRIRPGFRAARDDRLVLELARFPFATQRLNCEAPLLEETYIPTR